MSRLLLVLTPHRDDFDSWLKPTWSIKRVPPFGLYYIREYLRSKGHQCDVLDCRRLIQERQTNDFVSVVAEHIKQTCPDVVGINAITATMPWAEMLCKGIRNTYPGPIILGGVHPSVESLLTLQTLTDADAICIGPGEEICLDVLDRGNLNPSIPGLLIRGHEDCYVKRDPEMHIDKYPFPHWEGYYTQLQAHLTGWMSQAWYAMTSRSCPYSCRFCASDWSKPVRLHSAEYVIDMFQTVSKNVDELLLCDDTIAINRERIERICRGIMGKGIRWACMIRANQADEDLLKLMKEAGCYYIGFGIESGSQRVLDILNKRTTVDMNHSAILLANKLGFYLTTSYMIGVPDETNEDMQATLAFMKNHRCNGLGIGVFRPLPGSSFYKELRDKYDLSDWENLGNFSELPKQDFSKGNIPYWYDKAISLAYATQFACVTSDVYKKNRVLIDEMAKRTPVRVQSGDDYRSSTFKPLNAFGFYSLIERPCIELYLSSPYVIRRCLKSIVRRLARVHMLKRILWRYRGND